ncbi:hypothetical protein [Bacteroides zoogleoformans]|uniref:Secreted protein n=1 Tax=Bacteroides zoogleoformans TaxID=28119 RepID=A0ABM6T4Q4_9BACE|nr:hypothetical protein [Bacteroides zoogleoformans]AVM51630.1 hypothetical protein C4H11_00440 [Bacteroides zoogleoformans]
MINFCNVAFVAAYAIGGTMDAGCKNTDKKSFSAIIRRIFFLEGQKPLVLICCSSTPPFRNEEKRAFKILLTKNGLVCTGKKRLLKTPRRFTKNSTGF